MKSRIYSLVFILFFINGNGPWGEFDCKAGSPSLRPQVLRPSGYQAVVDQMVKYSDPRIYLLSYPRSGNSWIRYCIEVLTQRPTASYLIGGEKLNLPFAFSTGHRVDLTKNPIWKIHREEHMNFAKFKYNPNNDLLICILRNPKECLIRHVGIKNLDSVNKTSLVENIKLYYDNLNLFHAWDAPKKILIYYEDIISDLHEVVSNLLDFLGDSKQTLDPFFKDYEKHKKLSLRLYKPGSQSRGDDLLYHSRKFSKENRKKLEKLIKDENPFLWEMYLNDRYSDDVLELQGAYKTHIINTRKVDFLHYEVADDSDKALILL